MKKFLHSKLFVMSMVLAVLLAGACFAQAQNSQPVLVVSLPSVNDLTASIDFVGQLAGKPGMSQQLMLPVQMFTQNLKGVDRAKPFGLVVNAAGDDFSPVVFLPMTGAKELLASMQMPTQEEDGALKLSVPGAGDNVYLRENAGWTFVSQTKDAPLPADPMKALAGLNPEYDVAVRVYLRNVPAEKKKMAIDQFRSLMDAAAAMQRMQGGDNPLAALSQKNMQEQIKGIEKLANEADQITIGWKLDRPAKNTFLDVTFTAVPGSSLDQELRQAAEAKTNFAGFLTPDAAFTLGFSGQSSPETMQQARSQLQQLEQKAEQAIDTDPNLPDNKRAGVKSVLHELIVVAQNMVNSGKSDGGITVQLGPGKFQAAMGFFVADGAGLEKALKSLITMGQAEPEFQKLAAVKLDSETYKDVRFHQISVKVPEHENEARKVLGDALELYIGAGKENAYVALGKGSMELVKASIDQSAAQPNKAVPPMQMSVSLGQIFDFAASMNADGGVGAAQLSQALAQAKGKDHILLRAKPISNGVTYRLEIEEGVLQAIGAMSAGPRGAERTRPGAANAFGG